MITRLKHWTKRALQLLTGGRLGYKTVDKIRKSKSDWWQTPQGAESFITNSNATQVPAAALMDVVVNGLFLKYCKPGMKVLDLGAGNGIVSRYLAAKGCRMVACDISALLLNEINVTNTGPTIETRKGDAYAVPAINNEFDVIVTRMFLGHFPDWQKIVAEMTRCCRPGGYLLLHLASRENADLANANGKAACEFATSSDEAFKENNPGKYFGDVTSLELAKLSRSLGLILIEQYPTTFFLHNRLIGRALGTDGYNAYNADLEVHLSNPVIRDFIVWFEQTALARMPVWMSYYNVAVLRKIDDAI